MELFGFFLLFFVILETVKLGPYIKTKILDGKFDRYIMELAIFFSNIGIHETYHINGLNKT